MPEKLSRRPACPDHGAGPGICRSDYRASGIVLNGVRRGPNRSGRSPRCPGGSSWRRMVRAEGPLSRGTAAATDVAASSQRLGGTCEKVATARADPRGDRRQHPGGHRALHRRRAPAPAGGRGHRRAARRERTEPPRRWTATPRRRPPGPARDQRGTGRRAGHRGGRRRRDRVHREDRHERHARHRVRCPRQRACSRRPSSPPWPSRPRPSGGGPAVAGVVRSGHGVPLGRRDRGEGPQRGGDPRGAGIGRRGRPAPPPEALHARGGPPTVPGPRVAPGLPDLARVRSAVKIPARQGPGRPDRGPAAPAAETVAGPAGWSRSTRAGPSVGGHGRTTWWALHVPMGGVPHGAGSQGRPSGTRPAVAVLRRGRLRGMIRRRPTLHST
jgi:hypothetical protein